MAPIVFDDVNVFTFAHSRMKKLINCCSFKVRHLSWRRGTPSIFVYLLFRRLGRSNRFHFVERFRRIIVSVRTDILRVHRSRRDRESIGDEETEKETRIRRNIEEE